MSCCKLYNLHKQLRKRQTYNDGSNYTTAGTISGNCKGDCLHHKLLHNHITTSQLQLLLKATNQPNTFITYIMYVCSKWDTHLAILHTDD